MSLYDRFFDLQKNLKGIDSKKDLIKLDSNTLQEYYLFRAFLGENDKRHKPKTVRDNFKLYKRTAIKFKSDVLGYNLSKDEHFDKYDRYRSSNKIGAKVTDALFKNDVKLESFKVGYENIDTSYNSKQRKLVVTIKIPNSDLDFVEDLPPNVYINIDGTAYNKNGLDFIRDYYEMSNDFATNLKQKTSDILNIKFYTH